MDKSELKREILFIENKIKDLKNEGVICKVKPLKTYDKRFEKLKKEKNDFIMELESDLVELNKKLSISK